MSWTKLTAVGEVLARVEMFRMLCHVLTDAGSQAETEVGVDVDLADSHGSCFAELVFRDADSVSQVAAVFVDDLDVFRYDRRCAVEDDREARQAFGDFFEDVEAECRRYEDAVSVARALFRSEFESAVAGADSDGQGVDARAGYEFFDFFRTRIVSFMGSDFDIVFDAGQLAEFAFDDDAVSVCVFNDFFREGDIVFERMFRAVDHDGSETAVDAVFAGFKVSAVVEVKGDGEIMIFQSCFYEMFQIRRFSVFAGTGRSLKDDRRVQFSSGLGNALDDFHVVDVECTDSIVAS